MKMKSPGRLATMLVVLSAVWLAGAYGPMAPYIHAVKQRDTGIAAFGEEGRTGKTLRQWVEEEAAKRKIEPSNAVIDRVWKAVPGYNGRIVDTAATYARAKASGLMPDDEGFPWVYRDIPPAVGLDDLPLQPIYRGNPAKPMVALMINVAWGDEYLPSMLDTLDAENVKATFFLDGSWLSRHDETAKQLLAKGHELSNHAYTHPDMSRLDIARQRREIGRTEELLKKLGVRNRWFAPPSGDYDERTVKAAAEFGLKTVLWTVDTVDWKNPPPASVIAKIARKIGPGQLVLMHPTASTRDSLKGIISTIKAKGYRLGTVSETLSAVRVDSPSR